jgi:hypothetical protein
MRRWGSGGLGSQLRSPRLRWSPDATESASRWFDMRRPQGLASPAPPDELGVLPQQRAGRGEAPSCGNPEVQRVLDRFLPRAGGGRV